MAWERRSVQVKVVKLFAIKDGGFSRAVSSRMWSILYLWDVL